MPDSINGYTRLEAVSEVLDILGRTDDSILQTKLNNGINLVILEFWMEHDWSFAHKNGVTDSLSVTLATGTSEYTLNTAEIGFEMRNTDIDKIYCQQAGKEISLTKVDLRDIRHADPGFKDNGQPTKWAPVSNNRIVVHPKPTVNENGFVLFIDGRVLPSYLSADGTYLPVPLEYQNLILQKLLVFAYRRENDPKAERELVIYQSMLSNAKRHDMRHLESNAKFKWPDQEYAPSSHRLNPNDVMWNED